MTEKTFLYFLITEGTILSLLGLCILILPKMTTLAFGTVLCVALFTYGIYKMVNAIFTKNYTRHYVYNVILGGILTVLGLIFFFLPISNIAIITTVLGLYLIAESISSNAFAFQIKNNFHFWWIILVLSTVQFISGIITILGIPTIALWLVGMLIGINFLINGIALTNIYLANRYTY